MGVWLRALTVVLRFALTVSRPGDEFKTRRSRGRCAPGAMQGLCVGGFPKSDIRQRVTVCAPSPAGTPLDAASRDGSRGRPWLPPTLRLNGDGPETEGRCRVRLVFVVRVDFNEVVMQRRDEMKAVG
jgi:hypothetical protein